jgi:hypothetical protein
LQPGDATLSRHSPEKSFFITKNPRLRMGKNLLGEDFFRASEKLMGNEATRWVDVLAKNRLAARYG